MNHFSNANQARGIRAIAQMLLQLIAILAACVRMDIAENHLTALAYQEHADIQYIHNLIRK